LKDILIYLFDDIAFMFLLLLDVFGVVNNVNSKTFCV